MRILVVDDSRMIRVAVSLALQRHGHELKWLEFAVDLAPLVKSFRPDVVVMDLEMPGFSGLQLGRFLREQCRSSVPVLVYSALSDSVLAEAASQIGNATFLNKRYGVEKLCERINAMRQ